MNTVEKRAGAVGVQEDGIDDARVRHDLDGRVVLSLGAPTDAERHLRAPAAAAVAEMVSTRYGVGQWLEQVLGWP